MRQGRPCISKENTAVFYLDAQILGRVAGIKLETALIRRSSGKEVNLNMLIVRALLLLWEKVAALFGKKDTREWLIPRLYQGKSMCELGECDCEQGGCICCQ